MKDYTNPKRWNPKKIINKVAGYKKKLEETEKYSKEWYILQFKRELNAIKKHVVFFENLLDNYEKN